ncbi:MAG: ABC transporter substrate-binding protein [bacterium]
MSFSSIKNKVPENLKKMRFSCSLPSFLQCCRIFQVLTKKEKIIFSCLSLLFVVSAGFLGIDFYLDHTEIVAASGGKYTEGIVGQPRFINPIYGSLNDTDHDLVELLFSGLLKYDENGFLIPDLASEYKVLEDEKTFEVTLKENVFWSDGEKLTVDDLLFTIKTIQDPEYKSPLRTSWVGVETEKISDYAIRFILKAPYASFPENLTLKILPRHVWQNIPAQNFPLSPYNLSPISSGPYQLEEIQQNKQGFIFSLTLGANQKYHLGKPNIKKIVFRFLETEEELLKAVKTREIQTFSLSTLEEYETVKKLGFNDYQFTLPRYFAVFFNPEATDVLATTGVRKALNYGTDKQEIINKVFFGKGIIATSPILPEIYGFSQPTVSYEFNPERAKELLDREGFILKDDGIREKTIENKSSFNLKKDLKLGAQGQDVRDLQECLSNPETGGPEIYPEGKITGFFGSETKSAVIRFQEKYAAEILSPQGFKSGTGIVGESTRAKLNELCGKEPNEVLPFSFVLTTVNQPLLIEVANILKAQWRLLGVDVVIQALDIGDLEREIIKPRNYQALLFGEILGLIPDPFPFWHSSQKKDPGLNLALYENKDADKTLEEARKVLDFQQRAENLNSFQNTVLDSAPAIFLYSPDYIYFASAEIKGISGEIIIDPSGRFSDIKNWYLKTKRVWR